VKVDRQHAHFVCIVPECYGRSDRFEVRFVLDGEAIEHSRQLAASLRHRHVPNKQGLTIEVRGQSGQKLHEEAVYPDDEQRA
jgi:hypothetical protein